MRRTAGALGATDSAKDRWRPPLVLHAGKGIVTPARHPADTARPGRQVEDWDSDRLASGRVPLPIGVDTRSLAALRAGILRCHCHPSLTVRCSACLTFVPVPSGGWPCSPSTPSLSDTSSFCQRVGIPSLLFPHRSEVEFEVRLSVCEKLPAGQRSGS